MAQITGAMTTTNVLSDQLALDFGDQIALLEPSSVPLTLLTRMADKRGTVATKFSWFEDAAKARFDSTNGTANTTVQAIPVTTPAAFAQWDLVLNTRTGEVVRVDGVASPNLTVTRNINSTGVGTGVAMNSGDELLIIGTAQPENDTSKPARSDVPSKVGNNTQIFRTPWELSNSARASGYQLNPIEWDRQSRNKAIDHDKDIEYSFLFGRKSATTPGSTEDRTTGGILSFITTNQTDAGGDLSEAEFNAFMLQVNRYPASQRTKLAIASGVAVSALNKFPASKQMTQNNESTYGMDVTTYTSPFGALKLVWHPLLEGTKYSGYMIVVDMNQVAYRYLSANGISRDTDVRENIQPPDQDGRKDELLTECGLEAKLQKTHGVLTGITS